MTESASALSSWESFYVIVGSSGGALIGLQFVVITLIASRRDLARAGAMSAPWASLGILSTVLVLCGVGGVAYSAIVVRRARRQTDYEPVREDWIWHAVLPIVTYGAITVGAALLSMDSRHASFVIGTAALGLLIIGIHNAWDTVTHIVVSGADDGTA